MAPPPNTPYPNPPHPTPQPHTNTIFSWHVQQHLWHVMQRGVVETPDNATTYQCMRALAVMMYDLHVQPLPAAPHTPGKLLGKLLRENHDVGIVYRCVFVCVFACLKGSTTYFYTCTPTLVHPHMHSTIPAHALSATHIPPSPPPHSNQYCTCIPRHTHHGFLL